MNSLIKIALTIATISGACFAGEAEKSLVDQIYEKAVADNIRDADKTYAAYQKSLDAANAKAIKAIEGNIRDLNDPKKFGKLGMKERAEAITGLEEKIKAIRDGEIGSDVEKRFQASKDLLGEGGLNKKNLDKNTFFQQVQSKQWNWNNTLTIEFKAGGEVSPKGTWEIVKDKIIVRMGDIHTLIPIYDGRTIKSFSGTYGNNIKFDVIINE